MSVSFQVTIFFLLQDHSRVQHHDLPIPPTHSLSSSSNPSKSKPFPSSPTTFPEPACSSWILPRQIRSTKALVDPFPLVPVMWTTLRAFRSSGWYDRRRGGISWFN